MSTEKMFGTPDPANAVETANGPEPANAVETANGPEPTTPQAAISSITLANGAAQVLAALVPSLIPYAPVVELAMHAAETLAPEIYAEIKTLISNISNGQEPAQADVDKLKKLISALKQPDSFFKTPMPFKTF